MAALLKVIYLNSDDLDGELRNKLGVDLEQLIALELYSDGTYKYVIIKCGIVEYILGEDVKHRVHAEVGK